MEPRTVPLPSQIGRFRVEALLGSGGMGSVYRAVDPTLKRTVAIKTVRADLHNPGYLARLYREAQACARLQHPNIVTVHEAGEIEGVVYIAMELLKGEDLASAIASGRLSPEARVRVLVQILDALQHAHAEGVIHRDIKPSNVFILPDGTVKLVDFGLAHVRVTETVTASSAVMGTPHYASPEQLRGETVDHRTDIYSTGALAYELLTGRRPFQGDNDSVGAVVLRVMSAPVPPMPSPWLQRVPQLERIVIQAMAKQPADRYQSAADMRQALLDVLTDARDTLASLSTAPATASTVTTNAITVPSPGSAGAATMAARSGPESEAASSSMRWWLGGAAVVVAIAGVSYLQRSLGPSQMTDPGTAAPAAASPAPSHSETDHAQTIAPGPATPNGPPGGSAASRSLAPAIRGTSAARAEPTMAPAAPAAPRLELSAKQVFADGIGGSAGGANAGLRYRLTQRSDAGAEADVDPAITTFHSGDRIRFAFESNIDGHLYVVQQGSSGRWTVLFPNPDINGGRNAIRRGEEYVIPNDDWFLFDATPGSEQVFVFLSREPLTQLPGFDRPVTRFESLRASVVEDLQRSVQSRDLILEKDAAGRAASGRAAQAVYVVNRDALGKAVAATIVLTHGQ